MRRLIGTRVESIQYRHADGDYYTHGFAPGTKLLGNEDGTVTLHSTRGKSWGEFEQAAGDVKPYLINPRGKTLDWIRDLQAREREQAQAEKAARRFAVVRHRGDGRYGRADMLLPKEYKSQAAAQRAADKLLGDNAVVREVSYLRNARGRSMARQSKTIEVTLPMSRAAAERWMRDRVIPFTHARETARGTTVRIRRGYLLDYQHQRSQPPRSNPRGGSMAKRTTKRRSSSRRTRKAGGVPAWVRAKGFSTWAAYMESIRTGGSKMARRRRARSGGPRRRRRRRNPVALANPRRRRRRSAVVRVGRRRRRNPVGIARGGLVKSITSIAMSGLRDGAVGTGALAVARLARGRFGNLEGNTPVGIAVEASVGIVQALILRRMFGADVARAAAQGVFQGIITTAIKGANVPVVSPALGDEGELPLLSGIYDLSGVYNTNGLQGDELPLIAGGDPTIGTGAAGVGEAVEVM